MAKVKSKIEKLYTDFNVELVYFKENKDDIKEGDLNKVKLFYVKFTDKTPENKHQIYEKLFTVNDCNLIKKNAGVLKWKNEKFVELILYCLSKKNTKHAINYQIINEANNHSLNIEILYETDFIDINISFNILAKKMDEMSLMKARFMDLELKLIQTENNLRNKINAIELAFKKYKNESEKKEKELNKKIDELQKKPCIYPPILFKELKNGKIARKKGWSNIIFNDSDSKSDDISLNNNDGSINLKKGEYIINAQSQITKGNYIAMKFKSSDDSIVVFGNSNWLDNIIIIHIIV